MATAFSTATLNNGQTAISSNTSGTGVALGTGTGSAAQSAFDAIARCICVAVSSGGTETLVVQGSNVLASGYVTIGTFGTVSAVGVTEIRLQNVYPYLRWTSTAQGGTSNTCVVEVIAVTPHDSALADPV